jgi:hypothetical protein
MNMPFRKTITTCQEALELALEIETHLRGLYISLANMPADCEAKKAFRLLAEESVREIGLLVNELNACNTPIAPLNRYETEMKKIMPPDIAALLDMSSEEIITVAIDVENSVARLYNEVFSPTATETNPILANLIRIKADRVKALAVYKDGGAIAKVCSMEAKLTIGQDMVPRLA